MASSERAAHGAFGESERGADVLDFRDAFLPSHAGYVHADVIYVGMEFEAALPEALGGAA